MEDELDLRNKLDELRKSFEELAAEIKKKKLEWEANIEKLKTDTTNKK
jgi:hypothetical protein